VVTRKTLDERPAVVEGFAKATQRAWEYMVQSPREAVTEATEIIHKHVQNAPAADLIIEGALEPVPAMMRSRSTEGKPVGWSNPDDWRGMIAALQKAGDLPRVPTPEELMTNRFVE
jgi:ABC-type nitrate/sulfonate/bicarbonate transport system substrate-binding protein